MAPRVLFQLSGSIAAYKACHVVSQLVQAGCEVHAVATPSALRFVGPATLEGLTGRPLATDTFEPGRAMDHIHLVRWADVIVLCPASANTLNRLAGGIADVLVGTMFLAHDFSKPYVAVPAMNATMYDHPATARSLATLRGWGIEVIEPGAGALACGETGTGRLADPETIAARILALAATPLASRRLRVAVTAGGTKVPIDGVRAITNTSTGATGAAIADHFARRGHAVTLIHASDAVLPAGDGVTLVPYETFGELDTALRTTLRGDAFDAVIHLAAVSDFDIDRLEIDGHPVEPDARGKLDSGAALTIHLTRTPKLLAGLRGLVGGDAVIVGFKLTNGADDEARRKAVASVSACADLVVHNDVASGLAPQRHPATLYRGDEVVATVDDNRALATALEAALLDAVTG
jgi:phosphopantothenoylcysteine decarboxylase/phosphopantothenate--cysteine ligase